MTIQKLLLLVVIVAVVVTDTAVVISGKEALDGGLTKLNGDIRFAGTADGKTFFAVFTNSSISLNWHEASDGCKDMNMKLAEITSKAQVDTIRSLANSTQIWNAGYWIGGRDARQHRQFSWDSTNEEVTKVIGSITVFPHLFYTCIAFHPCIGCGFTQVYSYNCASVMLRYRLCEVPTSIHST